MSDEADSLVRLRVGTTLKGKYRLERLIGSGGMAAVYSAVHRNGNRVAIKILHPHVAGEAALRERFLREGYIANSVGHPGAVRVLDDDVGEDRSVFLVMELLEGETVDARANRSSGRLAVREICELGYQLLEVLAAAHAKGIVHRDIKPENLFLTSDGTLKVLDFGNARLNEPSESPGATRPGMAFGTPAFMAPEQALGKIQQIDAQTDVFSAGATLFTLASGSLIQDAESAQELMVYMATRPGRSLREVAPELPAAIADVIDRATRFQKHERWPDAASMAAALAEAHEHAFGFALSAMGGSRPSTLPWGEARPRKSPLPPAHPRLGTDGAAWSRTPNTTTQEELAPESAPAQVPRQRRASTLVVSALAAVVLVGLGVAALLSTSRTAPVAITPPPSAPPPARSTPPAPSIEPAGSLVMGRLVVRGGAGLRLFLDGQEVGHLPQELRDVSPGDHVLLLDGGERYERQETHLTLGAREEILLEPKLPVKRGLATFEAGKNAADARIEVLSENEPPRPLSTLPSTLDVPVGHGYRLVAVKPGFEPFETPLEFDDGEAERTFVVELVPVSVAAAPPKPLRSLPARPQEPISLDEEPPTKEVRNSGFLNLSSIPHTNVILDGKPIGNTPKLGIAATPGPHSIVFIHPKLGRKSRTVTVFAGQTVTVAATFDPSDGSLDDSAPSPDPYGLNAGAE